MLVYIGTLVGAVSLLFIQPHFLTTDELGLTRLILSCGTVVSSLLSFGISSVTVRYLPRLFDRERRHSGFFGFMMLYLTTSVALGLCVLYFLKAPLEWIYGPHGDLFGANYGYVILLAVSYSFVLGLNSYCVALLRSVFPTFVNDILVRLFFIALILLHFQGVLSFNGFLLGFCLSYTAQALILAVYALIVDRPGFVPDIGHMRRHIGLRSILRYGAVITFTAINSVSLKYLDSLFVGRIEVAQVAVYSVAAFIGLIIEVPMTALERIANPAVSHAMAAKDMAQVSTIYHRSSRFLLMIGGLMFLGVVMNVRDLLSLLPPEYYPGWTVSIVIAFGALINMATGVNHPILINSDRYIYGSAFLVVLLAITVIGNWLLIPHLGMMGAAVTSCSANIVYNGLKFEFIRRRFHMQPFDRGTVQLLVLITVLTVAGTLVPLPWSPWVNIPVRAVIALAVYVAVVLRLGLADEVYDQLPGFLRKYTKRSVPS
ncbi:MAG: polysaccharide biosynthesis C-terminal domain-containing protein [Bacteroidetes bacterium]|nr:polysaccharide biosynthesis C-terminal domain-containing protein [Bacteroidota bacterium]